MSVDPPALLADLKPRLKALEADLHEQARDPEVPWSRHLEREYAQATERERTARTWSQWLADEVTQAGVAWIVASVFVRFCEDNTLFPGPWIAGPGDRMDRAVDNENAYYAEHPTHNARDWLSQAFGALADLPAGRALVDPEHNLVWRAPISAEAARSLLAFWRSRDDAGTLVHDFTDPALGTRFLGDLYQDLSEDAQKRYALLQTPEFVERLILDRTLDPAIAEFGVRGLRLIDPACGSGHFLLGAFERVNDDWKRNHPNMPERQRVQRALDSLYGVDVNPFAVAITRFRLTVAALQATGDRSLANAPAFDFHVAAGDSLLAAQPEQGTLDEGFTYSSEDVAEYAGILAEGTFHVVVGNPPYITVKDKAANTAYRKVYKTCKGTYALSVPFCELFFRLARKPDELTGAGHVGQITSNSFMKREFGSKLIENLLSGADLTGNPVDLTAVIDTSGAYIPGHGTPTVILTGRRRYPQAKTVRAVLGIRGEPGQPDNPEKGLVWTEITEHLDDPGFEGEYVSVTDLPRETLAKHPWSLSGGAAPELFDRIARSGAKRLRDFLDVDIGGAIRAGADEVYVRPRPLTRERAITGSTRPFVLGAALRDFTRNGTDLILFPYDDDLKPTADLDRCLWPWRTTLANRATFQGIMADAGLRWSEYMQFTHWSACAPLSITFAEVATHNHFVLDRGGKVFKQTAPVIKLPAGASEDDHLDLLGVLNSSLACFWLKQVTQKKGGDADQPWARTFQFNATKVEQLPLPSATPRNRARRLDSLAQELSATSPAVVPVTNLPNAHERWNHIRGQMIAEQEELDWEVYRLYGLLEDDLTYDGDQVPIEPEERAFAIHLARQVAAGNVDTAWFTERTHRYTPRTEIPEHWPEDYCALVQRRLDLIASDKQIGLLERPEHKRRWATRDWEAEQTDALRERVLDRLEDPGLWRDAQGPVTRSIAQLADLLRHDEALTATLSALTGRQDVDLIPALTSLVTDEAVPCQAAHRYKEPGIVKFREWQQIWDLQRREDASERLDIPVPPKYKQADFRAGAYWRARGKLDVPKERLVSYPGTSRAGDTSTVLGWAGWNHAEQALALARLLLEQQDLGANDDETTALLAGLAELEPWLHQWHAEIDPAIGASPAASISALLDQHLARIAKTRHDLDLWRPSAAGKRTRSTKKAQENT